MKSRTSPAACAALFVTLTSGCSFLDAGRKAIEDVDEATTAVTEMPREMKMRAPRQPPEGYTAPALPVVLGTRSVDASVDPKVSTEFDNLLRALYSSATTKLPETGWVDYWKPRGKEFEARGYAVLDDCGAEYVGHVLVLELDFFTLSDTGESGLEFKSGKAAQVSGRSKGSRVDCRVTVRLEQVSPTALVGVTSGTGEFDEADAARAIEASALRKELSVDDKSESRLTEMRVLRSVLDEAVARACQDLLQKDRTVSTLKELGP